jgi:hypothetical protein
MASGRQIMDKLNAVDVTAFNGASQLVQLDANAGLPVGSSLVPTNSLAASSPYVLALSDNGKLVQTTLATAMAITIPASGAVNFPIGSQIIVEQAGAGAVTISGAGGVTVNSTGATAAAPVLRVIRSAAVCIKVASDTWEVFGDIV